MADGTSKRVGVAGEARVPFDFGRGRFFVGRPYAAEAAGPHAGDCAKQTQFAGGEDAPRRHGEHGGGYKCNWYNDLGLPLCASVVNSRGGEIPRSGSGPNCVKQTQFAAGADLPRRHGERRDECKCNVYDDLAVIFCGLRVSVVDNRGGEMPGSGAGPEFVKQTQFAAEGLESATPLCETNPILGGPESACVSLRRAERRGHACSEEKN